MKKIVLLLLMASMLGCNFFREPGKDRCKRILSLEKMTAILTDVYLMEGYLLELQISRPSVRDSSAYFYRGILDKHQVDYQTFHTALGCYLLYRDEIDLVHENILNTLSIKMGEIQSTYRQEDAGQPEDLQMDEVTDELEQPSPDTIPEMQYTETIEEVGEPELIPANTY